MNKQVRRTCKCALSAMIVGRCGALYKPDAPGKTRDRLRAMNINVHVSRAPRVPALDLPARGLDTLVRADVHY